MKVGMGANDGMKTTWNELEMATIIFRPTSPTNQNRPKVEIFNFRVFHPIWMKFGMVAISWLIMNQKQHRTRLKWLQQFFDASTDTVPHIPSRTFTLFRFL